MGMDFQIASAWVNTSRGLRQCQKGDKALQAAKVDSAADHYNKALNCFASAADHLMKAEDDANTKAGNLLDAGNQEMQKAIDQFGGGNVAGAEKHYDKALDKYDQAMDLID